MTEGNKQAKVIFLTTPIFKIPVAGCGLAILFFFFSPSGLSQGVNP
jgi:hypothetical protein